MLDFKLSDEQQMLVEMTRSFVEKDMMPHEEILETKNILPSDLAVALKKKSIELGLHACNLPEEVGGGGLDAVSVMLIEKELGRTSLALAECAHRPLNILSACQGKQVTEFLEPTVRGEKRDCIAMTEPEAGSDLRQLEKRKPTKALKSEFQLSLLISVIQELRLLMVTRMFHTGDILITS